MLSNLPSVPLYLACLFSDGVMIWNMRFCISFCTFVYCAFEYSCCSWKPMFFFVPWELLDLSYHLWQSFPSSKMIWFDKIFSFIAGEFANFHFQWLFHCLYVSNRETEALSLFSATNHDLDIGMASNDGAIVMQIKLFKILAPASASTRTMYLLEMLSWDDF